MKMNKGDVAAATIPAVVMAVMVLATTLVAERVSIQATIPSPSAPAPFPAPHFDSQWQALNKGEQKIIYFTHNGKSPTDPMDPGTPVLSGVPEKYMVDMTAKGGDAVKWGRNNRTVGSRNASDIEGGFYWKNMQSDRVTLVRVNNDDDDSGGQYRLKVWDFGP